MFWEHLKKLQGLKSERANVSLPTFQILRINGNFVQGKEMMLCVIGYYLLRINFTRLEVDTSDCNGCEGCNLTRTRFLSLALVTKLHEIEI